MWDNLKDRLFGFELKFGNGSSWKFWTKKIKEEQDEKHINDYNSQP